MQLQPFTPKRHLVTLSQWFQNSDIMRGMGMDLMSAEETLAWASDGKIVLIAEDSEGFLGMLNLYNYKTRKPVYEVGYLIDPKHQGKGLATLLVAEGIKYIRENLPEVSELTETYVEEFNVASKKVLERNGFEMYNYKPEKQRFYYRLKLL